MLYRKAPATPTRMLLRVAAAGFMAGACSGSVVTEGPAGSATIPGDAQADDGSDDGGFPVLSGSSGGLIGTVAYPPSGSSGGTAYPPNCCGGSSGGFLIGTVPYPPVDAGLDGPGGIEDASGFDAGVIIFADSGIVDSGIVAPCGGVCGSIIAPTDAATDVTPEQ